MKIMPYRRLKLKVYVVFFTVILFVAAVYFYPQLRDDSPAIPVTVPAAPKVHPKPTRHLSKLLTVVFRQFEDFENDIADSVQSFVSAFPNMPVLVICDSRPYPPFPFSASNETLKNVKVLQREFRVNMTLEELMPLAHISTELVLFVPDSTRAVRRTLQAAAAAMTSYLTHAIAIGVGTSRLLCQQVNWKYQDWTLQYSKDPSGKLCDAVYGPHALLMRTGVLFTFPKPFELPFPETLYLQSNARKVKIQILEQRLNVGRTILKSPASRQKSARHLREHRLNFYKDLGVKAVIREDGRVQWFGCKKETQRCFPPTQGTPSYILTGRNTPPCCRRNMRRTIAHVLQVLTQAGARCWLETTSLLGAVVRGDLLPWAEYAEIGIHASDVPQVSWLQRGGTDSDGFVWERATKGHYYRVAYSTANRVYVLILPFTARNGTMWPADWVLAHQKEFPDRHLHPLAQIQFTGREAPAPNDARAFLDLKLGANAVERCQKLGSKLLYP